MMTLVTSVLLAANDAGPGGGGQAGGGGFSPIQSWDGCLVDGVPTLKCAEILFGNLLFMSSTFIVLVLFVMFIIGAFNYLTSFGNPEKIQSARNTFMFAIIGLIVFVSAYLILFIIDFLFLGGKGLIFNFNVTPNGAGP